MAAPTFEPEDSASRTRPDANESCSAPRSPRRGTECVPTQLASRVSGPRGTRNQSGTWFGIPAEDWYKDYQHATNGLLILDEQGFDRIALGDLVPDPNIGKRIGPFTGMVINDEQGFERTGYGLLKVEGRYRVVLGLDSAQGREGLTLVLYDEGPVGLTVRDGERLVYVGSAPSTERVTGIAEPFYGLLVRGPEGARFTANAAPEK